MAFIAQNFFGGAGNLFLLQFDKWCQSPGSSPDLSQFTLLGFSGTHAMTYFEWQSGPEASCIIFRFTDDGDAPYTLSYTPGGEAPGVSIIGVDGTVGPAWSIPVFTP